MGKEIKKLMKKNNYELVRSNKHLVWKHKIFGGTITTSKTPSSRCALKEIQKNINHQLTYNDLYIAISPDLFPRAANPAEK